MSSDLSKEPNYAALIQKLIEATRAKKLNWKVTASPNIFLCTVKGVQSYRVSKVADNTAMMSVQDGEGKTIFEIRDDYMRTRKISHAELVMRMAVHGDAKDKVQQETPLGELYDLAQRVAQGIDARIDEAIKLLEDL